MNSPGTLRVGRGMSFAVRSAGVEPRTAVTDAVGLSNRRLAVHVETISFSLASRAGSVCISWFVSLACCCLGVGEGV